MQDEQQFEQLILQYEQLKNGSLEIQRLIEKEDYDSAITMIKNRESTFLNCKCMRRFLELTEEQSQKLENVLDELRVLELANMKLLENGMAQVKAELRKTHKTEKIQQAYDFNENQKGSIINYSDEA